MFTNSFISPLPQVGMISSIGGNGFKDAIERALAAVASIL
jgi:hypothetical protein